jgi:crossover junction endodeoxyribonuclease RuvC
LILGIDPGLDGALAVYSPQHNAVQTWDLPMLHFLVNKKEKRYLDVSGLKVWMDDHDILFNHVIMENPNAMPKQGITSAFNFGQTIGLLIGLVTGLGCKLTLVRPANWKRAMSLDSDKDKCRQRASQLFPKCAGQWLRKKDDGRAEAALLAYYGYHRGGLR